MSVPGVSNGPTVLEDAVSLVESANAAATTLTAGYTTGNTTLTVASNTLFTTSGLLTIGTVGLILRYTGKSGSTGFTGVSRASTSQEPNNPADVNVSNGSVVEQRVTSGSLGVLRTTLIRHDAYLGVRVANVAELLYANVADDALASGGTAELKFASQIALAASRLATGKVLRVRLNGSVTIDATAAQTTTIRIKLGDATNATSGTTLATAVFTHSGNTLTGLPWQIDCDIIIRSATTAWGGGLGTFASIVTSPYTSSSVALLNGGGLTTVTTIPNVSTVHTIHCTGQPNDTGQVITLRTMTVELLN